MTVESLNAASLKNLPSLEQIDADIKEAETVLKRLKSLRRFVNAGNDDDADEGSNTNVGLKK